MYNLTSPQAHFRYDSTSLSHLTMSLVELIEKTGPVENTTPPGRERAILKWKTSRSFTTVGKQIVDSFTQQTLSAYRVSGILLGTGPTAVDLTQKSLPYWSLHCRGRQ